MSIRKRILLSQHKQSVIMAQIGPKIKLLPEAFNKIYDFVDSDDNYVSKFKNYSDYHDGYTHSCPLDFDGDEINTFTSSKSDSTKSTTQQDDDKHKMKNIINEIHPELLNALEDYMETLPHQETIKRRFCNLRIDLARELLTDKSDDNKIKSINNGFLREVINLDGEDPTSQLVEDLPHIEINLETAKKFVINYVEAKLGGDDDQKKIFDKDDLISIHNAIISNIESVMENHLLRYSHKYDLLRDAIKEILRETVDSPHTKIEKINALLI